MRLRTAVLPLTLALAATTAAVTTLAAPASAAHEELRVVGLTQDGRLVAFDAGSPGDVRPGPRVTGLQGRLVGIDHRPADGRLYGVVRGDAGEGRVVRIDERTGAATTVAVLRDTAGAAVALEGRVFGVDFNPAADLLRVVSDTGQNLRLSVADRTAPTPLPGPAGTTARDGALQYTDGGPAAVVAAGYTNNDQDQPGTVLYDVDVVRQALAVQDPPNDGVLREVGQVGLRLGDRVGLDVYDTGAGDLALLSVADRGRTTLSVVDLATGAVVPGSTAEVGVRPHLVDIAVPPRQ